MVRWSFLTGIPTKSRLLANVNLLFVYKSSWLRLSSYCSNSVTNTWGPSIKDIGICLAVFDTPSPMSEFWPWFTYLLIFCSFGDPLTPNIFRRLLWMAPCLIKERTEGSLYFDSSENSYSSWNFYMRLFSVQTRFVRVESNDLIF